MSDTVLDEWQIILKQQKTALENCQKEHQVDSCMQCEKFLDCELRDAYVKAVYDSMSKGKGGGFEF
ncbi:hypothetical protein [Sulfurovum sp.]|uniref:hypothetical protein n=1 Tax=Sulfurovum sp. TaxID=1969726 RepID=UPI0025FD8F77|nr:hypothetical protein [Sulfurovum sp.]